MPFSPIAICRQIGTRTTSLKAVKLAFTDPKNQEGHVAVLHIGMDICEKLKWGVGTKISPYQHDKFPLVWVLTPDPQGWTLFNPNKHLTGNPTSLRMTFTWKALELPGKCTKKTQLINWNFYAGGIRLYLPGMSQNDIDEYLKYAAFEEQGALNQNTK